MADTIRLTVAPTVAPTAEQAPVVEGLPPTGISVAGQGRPVVVALAVVAGLALLAVGGRRVGRRT
jgi:hypothetical protein